VADLVSLEAVKRQLRLTDSEITQRGEEYQALMDQATAMVLNHCNTTAQWRTTTATWVDEDTTPTVVKAAILKQVAFLNQFRGDESESPVDDYGLGPGVAQLLRAYRDPVVA
jgi:Leu/Phe-tRNA-protein transferase